jgi:butyryl-CoA dehydrogenase
MANTYTFGSLCIITGAGSGIGRQLCLQGLSLGAEIIATDINDNSLQETHRLSGYDERLSLHTFDISDSVQIESFFKKISPQLQDRRIILINNAGTGLLSGMFNDTNIEDIEWLFGINFWGVVRMTKNCLPAMIKKNDGCIVNVSSVFGLGGFATQSAYCPTKFAVRGFTEVLRMELNGTNIRTLTVHPGGINTNIARNSKVSENVLSYRDSSIDDFSKVAITSPERAAQLIWKAVERNKRRLLIGADAYLIDIVTRLFPVFYTRIAWRFFKQKFTIPVNPSK